MTEIKRFSGTLALKSYRSGEVVRHTAVVTGDGCYFIGTDCSQVTPARPPGEGTLQTSESSGSCSILWPGSNSTFKLLLLLLFNIGTRNFVSNCPYRAET